MFIFIQPSTAPPQYREILVKPEVQEVQSLFKPIKLTIKKVEDKMITKQPLTPATRFEIMEDEFINRQYKKYTRYIYKTT